MIDFSFSRFFLMTTHEHSYSDEQHNRRNHQDGHNSDDSLLLMVDDDDDKAPLLNHTDHTSALLREENLANQSISSITHCHVPEERFDFGSRNRLILVLFICILFMGIEIAGMFERERWI